MIVPEDNLKTLLGLGSSITDEEQAMISLLHPLAEGAVKGWLHYDPEQKEHTEHFPRDPKSGGPGYIERDEVNIVGTNAVWTHGVGSASLQLTHIPVRTVASVHVDTAARYGAASGAFGDDTSYVQGTDYWAEWEEDDVCMSGCLIAYSSWPFEAGVVKVVYTAGYSVDELAGTAAGLNAAGITTAVLLTAAKAMHTWQSLKKRTAIGFVPGALKSEKLGDYSYTLGPGSDLMTAMKVDLPNEAKQALKPFEHYGLWRL